jgi:uncharacterized protein (DUF427 family)
MQWIYREKVLADAPQTITCDGHEYVPQALVRTEFLRPNLRVYHCPTKGMATYYDFVHAGEVVKDIAWSYQNPYPDHADIRGMFSFSSQVEVQA